MLIKLEQLRLSFRPGQTCSVAMVLEGRGSGLIFWYELSEKTIGFCLFVLGFFFGFFFFLIFVYFVRRQGFVQHFPTISAGDIFPSSN